MNRRDLLTVGAAAVAATVVSSAQAAEMNHDHMMMAAPNAKIVSSALECVRTGDACLAHCFQTFAAGDTSLATCAVRVDELIAACAALAKLASNNSPQLASFAKATAAICKDCEKECRKHADKHATCKACADACAACADECAKLG